MCWIPSDSSPENRILCTSSMHPKVEIECCQPCGFPAKLGLFFCGIEVFFENLRVACFWACFNCNLLVFWACFLQISVLPIAFSSNFMAIFCFNLFLKAYWECFGENFVILNLFFRICHHAFLFNFLADFSFCYIFLPTHVVFFSVKLPIFGLFFIFSCLFLQNNLASLLELKMYAPRGMSQCCSGSGFLESDPAELWDFFGPEQDWISFLLKPDAVPDYPKRFEHFLIFLRFVFSCENFIDNLRVLMLDDVVYISGSQPPVRRPVPVRIDILSVRKASCIFHQVIENY